MKFEVPVTTNEAPPSPLMLAALIALFGPLGTGMVMQGLGWHVMDWLHPNPDIPRGALVLLGVFLLACTLLLTAHLIRVPAVVIQATGAVTVAVSFVLMTWMVFDGGGQAVCFIGPIPSFVLGSYGTALCGFVIKAAVVVFDVIAVILAALMIVRRLRPAAPK